MRHFLKTKKFKKGFSALELMIVIGILGIIISIVIGGFSGFRNTSILLVGTEDVVSLMTQARSDALSSKGDSVYGMHFETNRVVLFKGSSFSDADPNNRVLLLDQRLNATNISLNGGGVDIVFNRLTGKTDQYGTIKVIVVGASTTFKTITIYSTGLVDIN